MWPLPRRKRRRRRRKKRSAMGWLFGTGGRPKRSRTLSPAWRAVRAAAIAENKRWYRRKTPTCERCMTWFPWTFSKRWPFIRKRSWQGDHIKPYSSRPDLELDLVNVQILCAPCNRAKSDKPASEGGEFNWKRLRRWWFGLGYPACAFQRWKQRKYYGWKV